MLLELLTPHPCLDAGNLLWIVDIATLLRGCWRAGFKSIGPVVYCAFRDRMPHCAISVVVQDKAYRLVNW